MQGIDTRRGPLKISDQEVMYRTQQQAVQAAKQRAGIPPNAKRVDGWQVGADVKKGELAKAASGKSGKGSSYVHSDNPGGYGKYDVYEVAGVDGEVTYRTVVAHTGDPNNFLPHVHAGEYTPKSGQLQVHGNTPGKSAPIPDFRSESYSSIGPDHHLTYQFKSPTTAEKAIKGLPAVLPAATLVGHPQQSDDQEAGQ